MLVHTWHITGSELTLKHSERGEHLLHFSFPSQLGPNSASPFLLYLSLPAVAAQKNPKAGKEL